MILVLAAKMNLKWVGIAMPLFKQCLIFYDNEGAVALTKEPKDLGRFRQIERKYHYIKHKVEEGALVVNQVSSYDNPVDPLTKGLSKIKHFEHDRSIGIKDDV